MFQEIVLFWIWHWSKSKQLEIIVMMLGCIMTRGGARADSVARVWLLLFCFSYSHTSGVGNNSSNSSGAGISSSIPSSVPLQPSAPPQINVIAATPNIEKKQARVLYDYDAADSSELTLLADEVRHHLALRLILSCMLWE